MANITKSYCIQTKHNSLLLMYNIHVDTVINTVHDGKKSDLIENELKLRAT